MKEIRYAMAQIRKGKDLEVYLPQFGQALAKNYYQAALLDLTMNEVMCYQENAEMLGEEPGEAQDSGEEKEFNEYLTRIQEEIRQNLLAGFDGKTMERSVETLDEMRNEIIKRMEVLTAYTDMLENYEYVLNRCEATFLPEVPQEDPELVTENVLQYIFDGQDNVIINEKIKEILGQLPVRMTKQKFYDLLRESLSIYEGSDEAALELYEYMIRTGAMLYRPEGMDQYYGDLRDVTKMFDSLDYEHLTKEQYESACDTLGRAADFIEKNVNRYVTLMTVINNLYVLVLTSPYGDADFTGREEAERVIRATSEAFAGKYISETEYLEAVTADLSALEGRMEERISHTAEMEAALSDAWQHTSLIESLMLRPLYDSLQLCSRLRSDSIFAALRKEENGKLVTEEKLAEVTENLIRDFAEGFERQGRMLRRAVMASVLNKMPVFFNSRQETMEYIRHTLESCTNPVELSGSVRMLYKVMGNIYD